MPKQQTPNALELYKEILRDQRRRACFRTCLRGCARRGGYCTDEIEADADAMVKDVLTSVRGALADWPDKTQED